jgi:predicted transcriptional regulator
MMGAGAPLCDKELAERLLRHQSTVRGAREALVKAGLIKHDGFKRFNGGRKAHMTWSIVKKGRTRNEIQALRKHILDGLHKISCMKKSISADRQLLRKLESKGTKRARAAAAAG